MFLAVSREPEEQLLNRFCSNVDRAEVLHPSSGADEIEIFNHGLVNEDEADRSRGDGNISSTYKLTTETLTESSFALYRCSYGISLDQL